MKTLLKKLFQPKKEFRIERLKGYPLEKALLDSKNEVHLLRASLFPLRSKLEQIDEKILELEREIRRKQETIKNSASALSGVLHEDIKTIRSDIKLKKREFNQVAHSISDAECEIDMLEQIIQTYEHWIKEDAEKIALLRPVSDTPTVSSIGTLLHGMIADFFNEQFNRFEQGNNCFFYSPKEEPTFTIRWTPSLEGNSKLAVFLILDEIEYLVLTTEGFDVEWKLPKYRHDEFCCSLYKQVKYEIFKDA